MVQSKCCYNDVSPLPVSDAPALGSDDEYFGMVGRTFDKHGRLCSCFFCDDTALKLQYDLNMPNARLFDPRFTEPSMGYIRFSLRRRVKRTRTCGYECDQVHWVRSFSGAIVFTPSDRDGMWVVYSEGLLEAFGVPHAF